MCGSVGRRSVEGKVMISGARVGRFTVHSAMCVRDWQAASRAYPNSRVMAVRKPDPVSGTFQCRVRGRKVSSGGVQ